MWSTELREELSQGDLISGLPIGAAFETGKYLKRGRTLADNVVQWLETSNSTPNSDGHIFFAGRGYLTSGVVLSHDCEIDKSTTLPILVAPIFPLTKLQEAHRQPVTEGLRVAFHFFPAIGDPPSDSYADLRATTFIPRKVFDAAKRERSMTDEARDDLRLRLVGFFTRVGWEPDPRLE